MSARFHIGDLTLDTGRHMVLRDSKPVALGPLTYKLLLTLAEAAPNVVTHDELVRSIWGGRSVSPETINQRIKLLRDALVDDPSSPRYVEGVRGQGYRLLPQVEVLPNESPPRRWPRWVVPTGAAISIAAAAVIIFWIMTARTDAVPQSTSVAVLPFTDLSPGRDQQYLADGLAEEILNLLSKVTTIRVIARTSSFSFRDKDADVARISNALGVTHVLEGSVRKEEDRIRVTVRLVDASNGSRLWSESYDQPVGDVLALETTVARSVASELKANLQNLADVPAKGVNAEAYELYLRGQHAFRMREYSEAPRYFEEAIEIDSGFIPAYHSLGLAYIHEVADVLVPMAENRAKLRQLVGRGLRLAPGDPGLLALSAYVARYDGDIKLAEQRFATAQQQDPSNRIVLRLYALFKLDQSYPHEQLALTRRIREIDPLNPNIYIGVWASYMDLGNAKEALAAAKHYREIVTPTVPTADGLIAVTRWILLGDLAEGTEDGRRLAAQIEQNGEGTPPWLPLLYYDIGDLPTADSLMNRGRWALRSEYEIVAVDAYRHLVHGEIAEARRLAVATLTAPKKIWGGDPGDVILVRLAVDGLIEEGEAQRAVDFLEKLAPEYARYKARKDIDPADFSPAPVPVKSAFSSFPALYFADYSRALRAVGDEAGANQMLDHLEAVLELRRKRGLFIEERHAAEALALRGHTEAALDALEKAERDRTIYYRWHLVLLHNEIFAGFRNHPRFLALVEKIQRDLSRQREQLQSAKN
ncbi:MAG TPA: winged helix-turn-helix domain-containing protein [Steroidobacteraceae bacterium]|nr:winged helix-turn-helix domain-containing protein [Steroidobacteraceae bacterium]